MHLILALSVIILQHVNSYSCRSILRTLDDLNSKSIEDSFDSYELRNEEIVELLQPFLELKPEEVSRKQQVQKNFAKLTIEPYLENNRTRKGQRNPFTNSSKRKTLAPLAIILTNLPNRKLEQADDKNKKEKSLIETVNENNLNIDSEDVLNKIQHHLMKVDEQKQISDEIKDIDTDKVEYTGLQSENDKKKPIKNILDDNKTKPVTSKTVTVTTRSPDTLLDEGKDLNDFKNSKKYEEKMDVKTKLKGLTEQLANKGISIESTESIQGVENSKYNYASDGYTLYPTDLENKDLSDSIEDKLQKVLVENPEALAQDDQLIRELSREDIGYAEDTEEEKLNDKENYELITSNLKITKASPEIADQTLEIENQDRIMQEPYKPLSKEDVLASHQKHLYAVKNEIVLDDEELNKEPLRISEDKIILGSSEELSKENAKENSQSHPRYINIVLEDDEDLSKEYSKENPLMNPQNHQHNIQENLLAETDKELSNEDVKEKFIHDYQNHLHSSHEMIKSHENWHHGIDDGHSSYTHKFYNLYFHFKR